MKIFVFIVLLIVTLIFGYIFKRSFKEAKNESSFNQVYIILCGILAMASFLATCFTVKLFF